MTEYHVGCGIAGIYAGTTKKKNPDEWSDKTLVTDEAIEVVRDWIIQDYIGGFNAGCHRGGCEWITKDGHVVRLVVEIEDGEYDNNDLILRGDALKAIRQRCIGEHLPFKSNTPVGERVLDALAAVYQVKPYKEESKTIVWHDAQNDPPKENGEYLCYYEYFRYGNYYCIYRTIDRGHFFNGQWGGEPTRGTSTKVLKWTELPLPESPEVTP